LEDEVGNRRGDEPGHVEPPVREQHRSERSHHVRDDGETEHAEEETEARVPERATGAPERQGGHDEEDGERDSALDEGGDHGCPPDAPSRFSTSVGKKDERMAVR
jgi:hypothetical protein